MTDEELDRLVATHSGDWRKSAAFFARAIDWRGFSAGRVLHVVDAAALAPRQTSGVVAWTAVGIEPLLQAAGVIRDPRPGPVVVVDVRTIAVSAAARSTAGVIEAAVLGDVATRRLVLHELGHVVVADVAGDRPREGLSIDALVAAASAAECQDREDRHHSRQWVRAYLHAAARAAQIAWPHTWWLTECAADVGRYLAAPTSEIEKLAATLAPETDDDAALADVLRRDPPPEFLRLYDRLAARRRATRLQSTRRPCVSHSLDILRQRSQQRADHALDTLAEAAKKQAAGEEIDVVAVDAALAELKLGVDDFATLVETAARRRSALGDLEKLASARGRRDKAQATLTAEAGKLEEAIAAYQKRAAGLAETINAATLVVDAAEAARRLLLKADEVPGVPGRKYREAIERHAAASARVAAAENDLREIEAAIARSEAWIRDIGRVEPEDVDPTEWQARPGVPRWAADGHQGNLEKHHRTRARAVERRTEIESVLAAARAARDDAARSLADAESAALVA